MGTSPVRCKILMSNSMILFSLCFSLFHRCISQDVPKIVKVGALIPLDTVVGSLCKSAIELAAEDVNSSSEILNSTHFLVNVEDSTEDSLVAAFAAVGMLRNDTLAIVGPQTSAVAEFIADLADRANVPVLTYAATDPSLSMHRHPFFMRLSQSNTVQMRAVADLVHHFNWRRVMLIYTDDDFGGSAIPPLNDALLEVQAKITDLAPIPPNSNGQTMRDALINLSTSESRVIIAHVLPNSPEVLFLEAQSLGMFNSDYVWILTTSLGNIVDSFSSNTLDALQGVLGLRVRIPSRDTTSFQSFETRWKSKVVDANPNMKNKSILNIWGVLAYDAVWSIAYAVDTLLKKGNYENLTFTRETYSEESFDVNVFNGGESLKGEILNVSFQGMSGDIKLSSEGEPSNCIFEVINVANGEVKTVGMWNKTGGLNISSAILWAEEGDNKIPRGWRIPSSSKQFLRIGVPYDPFDEMVIVSPSKDNSSEFNVTGFTIDVFEAALKWLDYPLPFKYFPYKDGNLSEGYYDDLVYQVYTGLYDVVVGDVTILANRSNYVDFTQPYSEVGLVMTIREEESPVGSWAFLQPFSPWMWIVTFLFLLYTGGAVLVLERDYNEEFHVRSLQQIKAMLWFSFSTLFNSNRETIVSRSARIALLFWFFVVMVLVATYTASLSSILTQRLLLPQVQSIEGLITQRLPIGYHKGSYVKTYLEQHFDVDESLLLPITTMEQYAEALDKGPRNGGVEATFIDRSVSQNMVGNFGCRKYVEVGQFYRTSGYGFVFPKGSPLVSDMSRAVLSLSESSEIGNITKRWFGDKKCKDTPKDSSSLSITRFWVVFVIMVSISIVSLVLHICILFYRFRSENATTIIQEPYYRTFKKFVSFALKKHD